MWFALLHACRAPVVAADPPPPRGDALYFALVDRFADGRADPPGSTDPDDPQGWHGGDLAGLIDRVEHLDALGFGGVWISPITAARTEPIGAWGAYHGYWMLEPDAVEPRFGTVEELRALSDALHARGMRLYLDLVVNHVGYDAPRLTSNPAWFHRNGDIVDWSDPVQVVTHDVHGLPDLAQEDPEVAAWLTTGALHWIEAVNPDGFRIDAVRHVPPGFLAGLGQAARARRPGLQTLGEVFDGNPARLGERMRTDDLDAVFDFPLMYGIVESGLCVDGAPLVGLASNLFTARHLPDRRHPQRSAHAHRAGPLHSLVTLLDNHDVPRLASRCARPADALALLWGLRGTPSVPWGTEVPLTGAHEPENRASMPWDAPHTLAPLLTALNDLRARWPALRDGDQRLLAASEGVLTVARSTADQSVLVAVRTTEGPLELPGVPAEAFHVRGDVLTPWDGRPFVGTVLVRLTEPLPPAEPVGPARISVEAPEGPAYAVVGTAPELGAWDAARAVPVIDGVAEISLPPGAASAVKLIRLDPAGPVWSQTTDRLVVAGGSVTVTWVAP